MLNQGVLVLNQNYEPLNVCRLRRALCLVLQNKASVIEYDSVVVHTVNQAFEAPSVIRLEYYIHKPRKTRVPLSRKSIFARDNYMCQYCGLTSKDLTLDHVIPRRLGGKSTWENLVSACKKCNNKKSDKTLHQANMKLNNEPKEMQFYHTVSFAHYPNLLHHDVWKKYLY